MIIENEHFNLWEENNKLYIETKKAGFPIKDFDALTAKYPRMRLHSFKELMKALQTEGEHEVGVLTAPCELFISPNKMKAELYIHATVDEFLANKELFLKNAEQLLDSMNVQYKKEDLFNVSFRPGQPIPIASGQEPVTGERAKITYIDMPDRKPNIRDDGSVDHYELNFVTTIAKDEWLGEKYPAKEGVPGFNVFGEPIAAKRGEDKKLNYDRKSVGEFEEDDKIVLRALYGGALEEIKGAVSIGKQLVIPEDVGTKTGSIRFDGSVLVKGTVHSGFSVHATGDISIEGNDGVTNAKEICSEGDVYIKGGVFGAGVTVIEAKNNIFIKHANNCKIYGKKVNIGVYSLGSEIYGEQICFDRHKGKVIGGLLEAAFSIECAYAGNPHERLTKLTVKGVNKEAELESIQRLAEELKNDHEELKKIELTLAKMKKVKTGLTAAQRDVIDKMTITKEVKQQKIIGLDQTIQAKLQLIQVATSPKIEVTKEAYPGVVLQIGKFSTMLNRQTKGVFEVTNEGKLNV